MSNKVGIKDVKDHIENIRKAFEIAQGDGDEEENFVNKDYNTFPKAEFKTATGSLNKKRCTDKISWLTTVLLFAGLFIAALANLGGSFQESPTPQDSDNQTCGEGDRRDYPFRYSPWVDFELYDSKVSPLKKERDELNKKKD